MEIGGSMLGTEDNLDNVVFRKNRRVWQHCSDSHLVLMITNSE